MDTTIHISLIELGEWTTAGHHNIGLNWTNTALKSFHSTKGRLLYEFTLFLNCFRSQNVKTAPAFNLFTTYFFKNCFFFVALFFSFLSSFLFNAQIQTYTNEHGLNPLSRFSSVKWSIKNLKLRCYLNERIILAYVYITIVYFKFIF